MTDPTLAIAIRCISDHYIWNDEISKARELATLLGELAEEIHGECNEAEERAKQHDRT